MPKIHCSISLSDNIRLLRKIKFFQLKSKDLQFKRKKEWMDSASKDWFSIKKNAVLTGVHDKINY